MRGRVRAAPPVSRSRPCSPGPPSTGALPARPGGDAAAQAAAVPEPGIVLRADQTHARWSATIPPVARVQSGAVVDAFTVNGLSEQDA